MSEFEELIYGKDYSDKQDKFRAAIKSLDDKYPDILEKEDSFVKHLRMTTNIIPGKITFEVYDPKDKIPLDIRQEMLEIFNEHFQK
jgi:hypothetical protein